MTFIFLAILFFFHDKKQHLSQELLILRQITFHFCGEFLVVE